MPHSRRKLRWVFTALAVIPALCLVELGARMVERLRPPDPVDARSPLSFQRLPDSPAFEKIRLEGRDYLSLAWTERPGGLVPVEKAPGEYRIVLLGGSAAAGMGVAIPATFASRLERLLNGAAPGRRIRVINLARTGYGSAQSAYLLEQMAPRIKPDLVLTVMGNNEYLDVVYGGMAKSPVRFTLARRLERHFATARLMRPPLTEREMTAEGGANAQPRGRRNIRATVIERLKRSIRQMVMTAQATGAGFLVCTVPVNRRFHDIREWFFAAGAEEQPKDFIRARWALRYEAPEEAMRLMDSRLRANENDHAARAIMSLACQAANKEDAARSHFARLAADMRVLTAAQKNFGHVVMSVMAAVALEGEEGARALAEEWINEAKESPADALKWWRLGTLHGLTGKAKMARRAFARALSIDDRSKRAGDEINHALLVAANTMGVPAFDLEKEVARVSPQGIPGWEYFLDYCHYNVRGHILVAHLLARRIAEIADLDGPILGAKEALREEMKLRSRRTTDLARLSWWSGADFDVSRLVNELIETDRDPPAEIARHVETFGPSAEAHTFLGNWMMEKQENWKATFDQNPEKQYRKALDLDPDFAAARENLLSFPGYLRWPGS